MIIPLTASAERQGEPGLRRLDPGRDLGPVADLIESAFADELDARGRAVLRDMRWMARLSPFVWWWAQADPSFRDSMNGFVWEAPSSSGRRPQIVGNVSLNRAPGQADWTIICNVAVCDGYRGRGIARRLTAAAVDEARRLGAAGVVLQVYRENHAALRLYTGLGFEQVTGQIELRLDPGHVAHPAAPATSPRAGSDDSALPGYRIESLRPGSGRAAFDLARRVTPATDQWLAPLRPGDYGLTWSSRAAAALRDLAAGRHIHRLAAWHGRDLAALLSVTGSARLGGHRLDLLVHPDHHGHVEAILAAQAMPLLAAELPLPVWATVNQEHAAALEALNALGFRERRTLLTLWKRL